MEKKILKFYEVPAMDIIAVESDGKLMAGSVGIKQPNLSREVGDDFEDEEE